MRNRWIMVVLLISFVMSMTLFADVKIPEGAKFDPFTGKPLKNELVKVKLNPDLKTEYVYNPSRAPALEKVKEKAEGIGGKLRGILGWFLKNWAFFGGFLAAIVMAFHKNIINMIKGFVGFVKSQSDDWREKYGDRKVFDVIDDFAIAVADDLEELADDYKKDAQDGKLSQEQIEKLNKEALAKFQKMVPRFAMSIMKAAISDLPGFFLGRVRARVHSKKKYLLNTISKAIPGK